MADKEEVEVSLGPTTDAVSITATLTVNGVECTARLSSEGLSWGDDDQACQEKGVAQGKNNTRNTNSAKLASLSGQKLVHIKLGHIYVHGNLLISLSTYC